MKATDKMVRFAEAISAELGRGMPTNHDFSEISRFISENKDDYYDAIHDGYGNRRRYRG